MKIIAPGGAETDLGITETRPTVGIVDYSRRVTDDFGVTTVVKRGFARRMSVRMTLPTDQVDGVQRRLAKLRATAVRWVADPRFDWLDFEGFYKDFDLDLAAPPTSYCTLTVEGLAESEAGADDGSDPAPTGRASSLRLIQPTEIDDIELSSSIPEDDYPLWAAGTTYALGARVLKNGAHRIYESAAAGNLGNDPEGASGLWIDIGATNRWAMFDQALGSATTANGNITVVLDVAGVDAIALLDVAAATVRVQAAGYDRTQAADAGAVMFLDLAGVPKPYTVTVAGPGAVAVGTLVLGPLVALGVTESSPSAGIIDFSRKEVDDFGEVTIVERAWAKRMATRALIRTDALDMVANRIASVRAQPALWIGDESLDSLVVYGFFKDFSIEVGPNVSTLSLSIEGLSEAAPIPDGTIRVDWPNVVDSDPVGHPRPADGATVGAPVGTPVGDRPAETVNAQLDAANAAIDELFETYGDTASASVSAGLAAAAAADASAAATAADGYAEISSTKRDEAAGFASAAQGSAVTAGDAAVAAQGSAASASASQSSAASHSNLAANFSGQARLNAARTIPGTFEADGAFFFNGYDGDPATRVPVVADGGVGTSFPTVAGVGKVFQFVGGGSYDISNIGVLQVEPGHFYRVTCRYRTLANTRPVTVYLLTLNSSWQFTGIAGGNASPTATTSWQTTTLTLSGDAMLAAGITYVRALARVGPGADALQWSVVHVANITESTIAGNKAQISTEQAAAATAAASAASSSETITANYRRDVLKIDGNFGFDLGKDNWFTDETATAPLSAHGGSAIVTGNDALFGKDLRQNPNQILSLYSGTMIPVDTSRKYRIWSRLGGWSSAGAGPVSTCYVGFVGLDANGNTVDHGSFGSYRYSAATGVSIAHNQMSTFSAIVTGEGNDSWIKFPPGTKFIRPMAILNYLNANIFTYIDGIFVEDVTERVAAETQASISTSASAVATAQAAAAQQSAVIAASVGKGYVNPNANFMDWGNGDAAYPNNYPGAWYYWNYLGGATYQRATVAGTLGWPVPPEGSPYCYRSTVAAVDQTGLQFNPNMPVSPGRYMVEATTQLISGNYGGAGILVYFFDSAGTYQGGGTIPFATTPDINGLVSGTATGLRRFSKQIQTFTNTAYIRLYAMANYASDMGVPSAKDITFLKVGLKSASETEATVASQAAVLATHDVRLASWLQRVAAGPGYAQIKMTALDSNGATATVIDMAADRITLGLTTVLEVVAGKVTVNGDLYVNNGKIIVDTGTHMKVIGNGFGSAGQFVEWFGPKMAINLCTEANGNAWLKKNGDAYFGGTLSAGILKNAVQTTSTSPTASVTTGSFGSNGGARVVTLSYSYSSNETILGACPANPTMTASIELYRGTDATGVLLTTLNITNGTWSCSPGFGEFEPGGWNVDASGALTYTDNSGGASASYFARISARNMPVGSTIVQRVGIVSTEA